MSVIVPQDSMDLVGKVVLYQGKLARIVSVGEGRTVHMRFVEERECPTCGQQPGVAVLVAAPIFQSNVRPAPTLESFQ